MASERQRQQQEAAKLLSMQAAADKREARFDEFLFLVKSGSSAEDAALRLGTNPLALVRQAYRWQRKDIVTYLSTVAYRQRHGL